MGRFFISLFILLGGFTVMAAEHEPMQARSFFTEAPDGIGFHYQVMGEGTPVLFLHGYYGTGKANWYDTGIAQELAKTNQVITLDFRGHGLSDKPRRSKFYGANLWQDALQVLDEMGIEKAHIHGFSMGGTVLNQILFHAPERVLTATFGGSGVYLAKREEFDLVPDDLRLTARISAMESRAVRKIIRLTKPDMTALAILGRNTPDQGERRRIDLTQVNIPVLAINGEYDLPNFKTFRMQRDLKFFRNVVIKNRAHASLITPGYMPEQYLNETVSFIRSNNP